MHFAIIGANSYIARNLIYYVKQAYPECRLDLYDYAEKHADGCENYKKVNVLDQANWSVIDLNVDVIFFFVGKTGTANGFEIFNEFIDVNERSLLHLLKECVNQGSKAKIVFPSTRLVYKGKDGLLKEDDEKEFKTIYAINKYACEQYLEQYHRVYGINYCIFRICVPYGTMVENASSYGTAEFMQKKASNGEDITLYGEGEVRRTLTYMEDLCRVLAEGALSENCINDVYNIGGEDYSLKEMALLIASKYGVGVKYIPWPQMALIIESGSTVFDDTKLYDAIKVQYKMRFEKWCELKGLN